jgi:CRP/FNR family transcriptional regulator
MGQQEIILRTKLNAIYADIFEDKLIDEIIKIGRIEKINKNQTMIDLGQQMTEIPLILNGIVKIIREDEKGDELVLYYLEPGDTCAISFVNCIHRSKSIFKGVVEKNMEAIFIPVEVIDKWLVNYKSWRHFIIDSYHFRLIEMVESIAVSFKALNLPDAPP